MTRLLLLLWPVVIAKDLVQISCERDPSRPYCKEGRPRVHAARTHKGKDDSQITEHDRIACAELRLEYVKGCAVAEGHRQSEFCQAFENICFRIPAHEPDQLTATKSARPQSGESERGKEREQTSRQSLEDMEATPEESTPAPRKSKKKKTRDFSNFCGEFKNRYLYVCPDPFRFGQKAVVFCPIYSERCHVPLPDKPVIPTRKPPRNRGGNSITRLCNSYRNFAETYCNNPILLSQSQYRAGCEKYWRFCVNRKG